jgi:protein gp37
MGEHTNIAWCDHTFNPWIGCTKISPACDGCYAADLSARYGWAEWGDFPRQRTAASTWAQPRAWDRKAARDGVQRLVFCASLADVFDNQAPAEWRRELYALIRDTPNLVWLLLTKRIGNAVSMSLNAGGLPRNAALGATMANQPEYDRDRMKLHRAKEQLRPLFTFGSLEPLLGPIILDKHAPDWIIVGGESGRAPRVMPPQWALSLRDQSSALKRAFFFKQWGGRTPKAAGKSLDGREWCDRPQVTTQSLADKAPEASGATIEQEP